MIDELTGWAISRVAAVDHVLRTTDGGATWKDVTPPETNFVSPPGVNWPHTSLSDFLNANTAWVTYWVDSNQPNAVWQTRDGGQTWAKGQPVPANGDNPGLPTNLTFVDAQTGWLFVQLGSCGTGGCDDHVLYATTDGGQTWESVGRTNQGGMSSCVKTTLAFVNIQTGWLSGYCAMALVYVFQRTDDGGRTWQPQVQPPPPGEPNLLDFSQSAHCEATGPIFSSVRAGVLDIFCPGGPDVHAHQWLWLYVTSDGGQTWTPRQPPSNSGAVFFVGENSGWWLSFDERANPGVATLYQTLNDGETWSLIKRLGWIGALDFIDPQIGWAVAHAGDAIALVKTVDGGRTWQELKPHAI